MSFFMNPDNRDVLLQMSPAPATTAEEAMAPSGEKPDSRQPAPDLTPLHRPSSVNGQEPGREEGGVEAERWAAAMPPVKNVFPYMLLHGILINHE